MECRKRASFEMRENGSNPWGTSIGQIKTWTFAALFLGTEDRNAQILRRYYLMMPIRKAFATAWVRLTVLSFFVVRFR